MRHLQTAAHQTGWVVAFSTVDVRVSCFYQDSCAKKAAAFFKKSISHPGLTQLGFDFLVLGKLGRRHFLTLDAGMGFPPLVHPVSHGLRDQTVGLCHLADRTGLLNDLQHDLLFELFAVLRCGIIQILPHIFD